MLLWFAVVTLVFLVLALVAIVVGNPFLFVALFVAFLAYAYFVFWAGKRRGAEITSATHAWKDKHIAELEKRLQRLGGDVVTGFKRLVHAG
jgi:uncharacterized RDD family membrane protein YckC